MTKRECAYCRTPLPEGKAQFAVRAPGADTHERALGLFCSPMCWEAASAVKSVNSAIKILHGDVECVLSEEGKLLRV